MIKDKFSMKRREWVGGFIEILACGVGVVVL